MNLKKLFFNFASSVTAVYSYNRGLEAIHFSNVRLVESHISDTVFEADYAPLLVSIIS